MNHCFSSITLRNSSRARLLACLALVLWTSFHPGRSSATWNQIQQFTTGTFVSASYFFSPDTGIIGFTSVPNGKIMRTTNGGLNWTPCSIPTLTNTMPQITDIWFASKDTGWCTVAGKLNPGNPTLWRTDNNGQSWYAVNSFTGTSPSGVRLTSHALIVTEQSGIGIHVSIDSGKSWATTFGKYNGGVDFLDDNFGVATSVKSPDRGYQNRGFFWTNNGGRQWQGAGFDFVHEAWRVYAMKHSTFFIAAAEDTVAKGSRIFRSKVNSNGYNWDILTTLPFQANGCVNGISNGNNNVMYVQNTGKFGNSTAGLYRSRDSGANWTSVGGPNENCDVEFSVLRCGDVIYAYDDNGGLWKTTNGGDGAVIPECICINKDSLKALTSTVCDSTHNLYWLHNPNVGEVVLEDIRIVDSNKRPAKTSAIYIDSLPGFYPTLLVGDSVAFKIGWHPRAMMDSTASDTALVRIIFYAGYLERVGVTPTLDTFYRRVSLHGLSLPAIYALSANTIRLDSVQTCTVDTLVNITNQGCDSLTITKATLWKPLSGWTLTDSLGNPVKLPVRLGIGSSMAFHLLSKPAGSGVVSDSLRVTMHYQGYDSSLAVYLRMTSKLPDVFHTPAALSFDSLATCAVSDTLITVSNSSSCGDTLYLRQEDITSKDWTILDKNGNPITKPIAILSGQTDSLMLRFAPKGLGQRAATLRLHYHYLTYDSSNATLLTGFGATSGTVNYAKALDFGSSPICGPAVGHDTVITFHNTSCDSAHLVGLGISGPFIFLDSARLPLWISSGKSVSLRIRYIPHAKGTVTGQGLLTLLTNNGQTTIYDTLKLSATAIPGSSTFDPTVPLAAHDFGTKSSCDNLDSVSCFIVNHGCDTMTVTAITMDAGIASDFEGHTTKLLPVEIPGGDTVRITLAIAQLVSGTHNGNAHIHFQLANGSVYDSVMALSLIVTQGSGASTLQLISPTSIDFGAVSACGSRDTEIVYADSGCGPITVNERSISGAGFTMPESGTTAFALQPGKKDTLHIHYAGATSGNTTATVTVKASGQRPLATYTITASSLPVESVNFKVSFSKMPIAAGESFTVFVKPDRAIPGKGIRSIAGVLVYHADAFNDPSALTGPPGLQCAPQFNQSGRDRRVTFVFTSAKDISLDPNVPILSAGLSSVVGDSASGMIWIDSLKINGNVPKFSDCVLASKTIGSSTQFKAFCGDSTIMFRLRGAPLITAERLHPNPVTAQDNFQGTLDLHAAVDGVAEIDVTDAIGRPVSTASMHLQAGQASSYVLDLAHQPAGTYFYAIRFSSEAGRAMKNGMVVLVK